MARVRYFDYRSPDATLLLNEWRRGILQPGVYFGYNAVPGSAGLAVSLDMDADPDKPGGFLGTIITRDGVVIQEDADLTDVATATAAHPTLPRIDLLVATYIYNAGLPNNDVTYEIVAGTAAATPVAPAVNDNQVILAYLYLDAAQTVFTADDIVDVERKDLYATGDLDDLLEDIIIRGVYKGYLCKTGTNPADTTLEAGNLLSAEYVKLRSDSDQVDLFTHSGTSSANHYRYDWIVAMHKKEDIEGNEDDIDYILVEGTEADESAGAVALVPSNANILTAAQAVDPKYTSNDYINRICLVKVQGLSGSMQKDYIHWPKHLNNGRWYVSGGSLTQDTRPLSGYDHFYPFKGSTGLALALDLLRDIVEDSYRGTEPVMTEENQITLFVEGNFYLDPDQLYSIPSFVKIKGIGGARFYVPEATHPVVSFGHTANTSIPSTTIQAVLAADQSGVPGGYERWELGFNSTSGGIGSYSALSDELVRTRFAGGPDAGDPIYVYDSTGGFLEGWFEEYTTVTLADADDTFRAILPSATAGTITRVVMYKQRAGIEDVAIETKNPTTIVGNFLSMLGCRECLIQNMVAPAVEISANNERSVYRNIRVDKGTGNWLTRDTRSNLTPDGGNVYDNIYIRPVVGAAATIDFGRPSTIIQTSESHANLDSIILDLALVPNSVVNIVFRYCRIGSIRQVDGNNNLVLAGFGNTIDLLQSDNSGGVGSNDTIEIAGTAFVIGQARVLNADPGILQWTAGSAANTIGNFGGTNPQFVFGDDAARQNYCLNSNLIDESVSLDATAGTGVRADEAPHYNLISEATISWSSGTLTFDDDIIIELPYAAGRMVIDSSNSPIALADGERIYVHLQHFSTIDVNKTPLVVSRANALTRRNRDELIIAMRVGDTLYWLNGSVFPDGVTGTLDNATPLDNSVTHPKLEETAKAFVNAGLNSFFSTTPGAPLDLTEPTVRFAEGFLKGLGAWSINANTGLLSCAGMTQTEWESANNGDEFIDVDGDRFWIVQRFTTGWRLKPGSAPNLTISSSEDDLNVGASGGVWESGGSYSIVTIPANRSAFSFRVDMASGSIPNSIKEGYLLEDRNGDRFKIWSVSNALGRINVVAAKSPATYSGGTTLKVITHSNPRELNLMDMKPAIGVEVLPIASVSRRISSVNWEPYLSRISSDFFDTTVGTYRNGADPRILFFGPVQPLLYDTYSSGGTFKKAVRVDNETTSGVVITAFMTGVALMVDDIRNPFDLFLDGRKLQVSAVDTPVHVKENTNISADDLKYNYRSWWILNHPQLSNMAPGVHTLYIRNSTYSGSDPADVISGVVIANEPNYWANGFSNPERHQLAPGRLYADMTYWDYLGLKRPPPTLTNLRGGKAVLYSVAPTYTTHAWATSELSAKSDTGSASSVSPTITGLSSPGQFVAGDIVRLNYGSTAEKRLVTVVGATSIDVSPNPAPPADPTAVTIEWLGTTWLANLTDSQDHDLYHPNEQEVMAIPFYALGSLGKTDRLKGWLAANLTGGVANLITNRAETLPDNMQYAVAEDVAFRPLEYWMEVTAASTLRIGFIGTGFDIIISRATTTTDGLIAFTDIVVDGVSLGSGTLSPSGGASDPVPESYWNANVSFGTTSSFFVVPIVQEMEYGFHVIEFDFNPGAARDIIGYRVYEPKDPSFDGVAMWEGNFLANTIKDSSDAVIDDTAGAGSHIAPTGLLSVNPDSILNSYMDSGVATRTPALDVSNTAVDPTYERGSIGYVTSVIPSASEDLFFVFYGRGFGLELEATAANIDLNVQVMDLDGQWKDIGSLNRAIVTGAASTITNIPTSPTRYFWSFWDRPSYATDKKELEQLWSVKLEVSFALSGNALEFRSMWLDQRYHLWQREDSLGGHWNEWLVPGSQGRDRRVLQASNVSSIQPPIVAPRRGDLSGLDQTYRYEKILVLSEGEYWTVEVEFSFYDVTNLDNRVLILNWENGRYDQRADTSVGSAFELIRAELGRWLSVGSNTNGAGRLSRQLYLDPGWHLFSLNMYDYINEDITEDLTMPSRGSIQIRATPNPGGSHSNRALEATIPLIQKERTP